MAHEAFRLLILLFLLSCLSLGQIYDPQFDVPVDFSPFRNKISELLQTRTPSRLMRSSDTKDCAMPDGGIMFTYSNYYMMDFIVLQHKSMELWGLRSCLEKRFVTVCLDSKCTSRCELENIPNCVRLEMKELPASDFAQAAYRYFTFLKHELMLESLKVASEVFYFDADLLLFRNPWPDTLFGRDELGQRTDELQDIMYQRDRGRSLGCMGTVNTGQVYLRNSSKVQQYLANMMQCRAVILEGKDGLDQDFVHKAFRAAGLTRCTLSTKRFTGHCPSSWASEAMLIDLVSYHTSCVMGFKEKKQKLASVLFRAQSKSPSQRAGSVL